MTKYCYAFLDAIARSGGGTYVVVESPDDTAVALVNFMNVLGAPVITDLKVGPKGGPKVTEGEVFPGRQIALVFPLSAGQSTIEVSGTTNGKQWLWEKTIASDATVKGIGGVWATEAIGDLEVQESIEWHERLEEEWTEFFTKFEKVTGKQYWDVWDEQWKVAFGLAPKNAAGFLDDYQGFWASFRFVSPIPEPQASKDYAFEEQQLALRHHVIVRGLTMLVAVDPQGPRRATDRAIPIETVLANTPPEWHLRDVFGLLASEFAVTFAETSITEAFTDVVVGTPIPRADSIGAPPVDAPSLSFTGPRVIPMLGFATLLVSSGIALLLIARRRRTIRPSCSSPRSD